MRTGYSPAQYTRTLSKSLSCQFRGELLQVRTGASQGYHLRGVKVTICEDATERSVTMLHKDKPLEFKRFERHELPERHADDKTLELRVEQARQAQRKPPKPYAPPPSHPWKRGYINPAERAAASK
jgi:hypothetical protein